VVSRTETSRRAARKKRLIFRQLRYIVVSLRGEDGIEVLGAQGCRNMQKSIDATLGNWPDPKSFSLGYASFQT
jgi:hypothetical protein